MCTLNYNYVIFVARNSLFLMWEKLTKHGVLFAQLGNSGAKQNI